MRFIFNERKAAQAAAYLVNKAGGTINYMVMIKLLYLSDRAALIKCGLTITGGHMVSMPFGPVISDVLNLINLGRPQGGQSYWHQYISEPDHYNVSLANPADQLDCDELSRYEESVLDDIFEKYGMMDKWTLVELTHTLPEWNDPNGSSRPIKPQTILEEAGKSSAEIERLTTSAALAYSIDALEG